MRIRPLVVLLAIQTAGLVVAGCAGNASPNPPPPPGAPQIIAPPVNQAVTAGQSASFNVTAAGAAPLSYQWTKNGNPINGATSATFSTPPTSLADNGSSFSVVVSNSKGSIASTAATLTVNPTAATLAITSATGATFLAGTPSSFTVTATGAPTPFLTETGTLPIGVTFTSNGNGTGILSGTAAAVGSYPITLTATNGFSTPASQSFTLTVNSLPAITSAGNATFTVGTPGTFSVTTTGTPTPSLTETGALPSGLTFLDNLNGTATLSGTPAAGTSGIYPITINASSSTGSSSGSVSQSLSITVDQTPAITSAKSTTFTAGTAGTFTVTTTGFPTASLTETGALPSGVTFTSNANGTGTLAGTPAAGTGKIYSINFTATNAAGSPATQSFTLTVNGAPAITSGSGAAFALGTSELFAVLTTGFPAPSLTETGALPTGVTFTDNGNGSGRLAGIATAGAGTTFPITFTATNGIGSPATQSFTLTVDQAPAISSANNTAFTVGTPGSFSLTTTGFPAPTLTETGALPAGVTFAGGSGVGTLSGTPAAGTAATYPITFTATNGVGTPATQAFTLTVNATPTITSATSTTFAVGAAGTFSVTTTGTPTPSLTETGALPAGVTFTSNANGTGTLAGTPAAGMGKTYPITFTASNGVGTPTTQTFTLTVNQPPAITSANSATFTAGAAASFTVSTTGFPTPTLSETGALPSGVAFTSNANGTGTLSGTPAAGTAGSYPITFSATNGVGTAASQTFTLTVSTANAAPVITSATATAFTAGTAGTFSVTTTGSPTPSLTETGTLPAGVTFTSNANGTGTLAGTPAAGTGKTYPITLTASNGVGTPASQTFTLTVDQAPVITSPTSTTFNTGASASFTVLTTGFPAPSLAETGALPSGVTFADKGNGTGTLSGTASAGTAGTYSMTFTATNGIGTSASQAFTLTVTVANVAPAITSAGSTTFTAGTAGTFSVATTGTPTPTLTETGALPSGVTFKDNANGTATLGGTPAAGTAGTYPITFTASNGTGTPATQSFALTVSNPATFACGSGHESVLNGQFAFYFQGFDANGPVAIAGSFSADGAGKVALLEGVEDINTSVGVRTNVAINSAGSSYSVGADNRGCLTLATSSGTAKYAISLGSLNTSSVATRGRMIEIDSTGTLGSGVMHLQDPTAFPTAISGSFVFEVSSTLSLSTTTPNRFAMAGSLTASGGVITSGEADFNLSGSVNGGAAGPLAITNGSYSVSPNGRGTLTFDVSGAGTFNAGIYIVSATEFYQVDIDPQSLIVAAFAGDAQSQTGPFTTSSLSKNTVFYSIGLCGGCGPNATVAPDLSVGVITVPAAGNFTLSGDQNQGGVITTQSLSGTYTVDSRGRVALQSGGSTAYILYLQTTDRAFLLSTGSEVGEGSTDGQSAGPFTNASVTGTYFLASTDNPEQNVTDASSVATFDGLGTASGTSDSVSLGSAPSTNTLSETYSVGGSTLGRGTITANGVTRSIFYIISKSRIVQMDVMNSTGAPNPYPTITTGRQ